MQDEWEDVLGRIESLRVDLDGDDGFSESSIQTMSLMIIT
jgi:hypothetical protein